MSVLKGHAKMTLSTLAQIAMGVDLKWGEEWVRSVFRVSQTDGCLSGRP